jgi:hypothetical protein
VKKSTQNFQMIMPGNILRAQSQAQRQVETHPQIHDERESNPEAGEQQRASANNFQA